MIIPKSNQAYDVADGAAQRSCTDTAGQQWEDDGGPLQLRLRIGPLEYSTEPTWNVLSLRDLNLAIRIGHWPDNPAALQRAAAESRGDGGGARKENP